MNTNLRNTWIEQGLFVAWAISLVATMGSLFFSEVIGYIPCELCWYQRIFMYPLTIILGIAVVKKFNGITLYVFPLASIGASISFYHYLKQKLPYFQTVADSCGLIPCTTQYINWLGFITIPFLALTAFTFIAIISFSLWRLTKN